LFYPYQKKFASTSTSNTTRVAFSLFQEGLFCFKCLNSYQNGENNNVLLAKNVALDIIVVVVVIIIIIILRLISEVNISHETTTMVVWIYDGI